MPLTCSNSFKKILRRAASQQDLFSDVRHTQTLDTEQSEVEHAKITLTPTLTSVSEEYAAAAPEIAPRARAIGIESGNSEDARGEYEGWYETIQPEAWAILKQLYPNQSDQEIHAVLNAWSMNAATSRQRPGIRSMTTEIQPRLVGRLDSRAVSPTTVVGPSPTTPSTNTAERFYRVPWRLDHARSTAALHPKNAESHSGLTPARIDNTARASPKLQLHDDGTDFEEAYRCKMSQAMAKSVSRTVAWLTSQNLPKNEERPGATTRELAMATDKNLEWRTRSGANACSLILSLPPYPPPASAPALPPRSARTTTNGGSLYYSVFESLMQRNRPADVLLYAFDRAAAIDTQRLHFPKAHRAQLLGIYALSPPKLPDKERARKPDTRIDREAEVRRGVGAVADMQRQTLQQLSMSVWELQAVRLIQGGRLIAKAAEAVLDARSETGKRPSILVLGAPATAGLGWALAMENAECNVCTVVKRNQSEPWQVHTGPANHRVVAVPSFNEALPFPAETFDLAVAWGLDTMLLHAVGGRPKIDSRVRRKSRGQVSVLEEEVYRVTTLSGMVHFSALDATVRITLAAKDVSSNIPASNTVMKIKVVHHDAASAKLTARRVEEAGFVEIDTTILGLPTKTGRGREGEERMDSVAGLVGALAYDRWSLAQEGQRAPRRRQSEQQRRTERRCERSQEEDQGDSVWRRKWIVGSARKQR